MSSQTNDQIIQPGAMPAQTAKPLPAGATSPMNAGYIKSQQQAAQQTALIGTGKTGGSGKRIRGGAASILVPAVPAGTVDGESTQANYTKITTLAQTGSANSVYDNASSQAQTAQIAANQNQIYKGGKKGGSHVKWGCMSGGKTKRKYKKKKYSKKRHNKRKQSRNKK